MSEKSLFNQINPEELAGNFIKRIGKDWMMIAAGNGDRVNMMTASWGGVGVYWNKPVAYCYMRPQRYTKEFADRAGTFSLNFFPEAFRDQLTVCGKESGRDMDKVKACGFDVLRDQGTPYFAQADTALICKTLISQPLKPDCFTDSGLQPSAYPDGDYHTLYIAEIVKTLVKQT